MAESSHSCFLYLEESANNFGFITMAYNKMWLDGFFSYLGKGSFSTPFLKSWPVLL